MDAVYEVVGLERMHVMYEDDMIVMDYDANSFVCFHHAADYTSDTFWSIGRASIRNNTAGGIIFFLVRSADAVRTPRWASRCLTRSIFG